MNLFCRFFFCPYSPKTSKIPELMGHLNRCGLVPYHHSYSRYCEVVTVFKHSYYLTVHVCYGDKIGVTGHKADS